MRYLAKTALITLFVVALLSKPALAQGFQPYWATNTFLVVFIMPMVALFEVQFIIWSSSPEKIGRTTLLPMLCGLVVMNMLILLACIWLTTEWLGKNPRADQAIHLTILYVVSLTAGALALKMLFWLPCLRNKAKLMPVGRRIVAVNLLAVVVIWLANSGQFVVDWAFVGNARLDEMRTAGNAEVFLIDRKTGELRGVNLRSGVERVVDRVGDPGAIDWTGVTITPVDANAGEVSRGENRKVLAREIALAVKYPKNPELLPVLELGREKNNGQYNSSRKVGIQSNDDFEVENYHSDDYREEGGFDFYIGHGSLEPYYGAHRILWRDPQRPVSGIAYATPFFQVEFGIETTFSDGKTLLSARMGKYSYWVGVLSWRAESSSLYLFDPYANRAALICADVRSYAAVEYEE